MPTWNVGTCIHVHTHTTCQRTCICTDPYGGKAPSMTQPTLALKDNKRKESAAFQYDVTNARDTALWWGTHFPCNPLCLLYVCGGLFACS